MTRVLIVEDEESLADPLAYLLRQEGFEATVVCDGPAALADFDRAGADIVLLDLMLPDLPGTEVCRTLRANPRTRDTLVLMLTARGEEIDRVVGFEVGADDYVVKPFSTRELALRIRALLRRTQAAPMEGGVLVSGAVRLDVDGHRCWVDAVPVALTATEARLLAQLITRRGRVQTRAMLLDDVWGKESDVSDRTVDAHIKRLREKLGTGEQQLETVRGVGYRWSDEPVAPSDSGQED